MRHRKYTFKIGRTSAHRRSLLANAVCSLFQSGRIQTTVTKAKQIRRLAEKMITLGKRGTLHARRLAIAKLQQPGVVAALFSEIAPGYEKRPGGYTRIIRTRARIGDAAQMCILELVDADVTAESPVTDSEATVLAGSQQDESSPQTSSEG